MEHRISTLFFVKKSKPTKDGRVPLFIRITINGQRLEHSIHRYVEVARWVSAAGRVRGITDDAKRINLYLDTLTSKVLRLEREMVQDGVQVDFDGFRLKWLGIPERPRMLIEVFQEHNSQVAALVKIGKEYAQATLTRYNTTRDHVRSFLQWKYKKDDLDIKKLNFEFVSDFEFWLKTVRKCNQNTTIKYIGNFRKIVNICLRRGWLQKDPFLGFKMVKQEVERDYLTESELETMANKDFGTERLNHVRDIFLFSCFTGLAYADVKKLRTLEISVGIDV
jgi:hypothetical protein